jgi:hypothetical protein
MTARSSLPTETIECPLCSGAGELKRTEVLNRLGVKDFARVAQLSAERHSGCSKTNTITSTRARGLDSRQNWQSGLPRSETNIRTNCARLNPKRPHR